MLEIQNNKALQDFLFIIEPLDIDFVGYQHNHINHLQDEGKGLPTLISILEKFHNNVRRNLTKAVSLSTESHTVFVTFQNIKEDDISSNNKDKKQLNQPNTLYNHNNLFCFCGVVHQFLDYLYIIKSKHLFNWTPNPIIKKKFNITSQNTKTSMRGA